MATVRPFRPFGCYQIQCICGKNLEIPDTVGTMVCECGKTVEVQINEKEWKPLKVELVSTCWVNPLRFRVNGQDMTVKLPASKDKNVRAKEWEELVCGIVADVERIRRMPCSI